MTTPSLQRPARALAPASRRYGTPIATYRLQLHAGFGFEAACSVVPYLVGLGVSHVYLSPIFAARPGSPHGYDVIDHSRINPELGGMAGLYALGEALVANDMGCVIDIVPNHVGVGAGNPWWVDVLRFGQNSRYAAYFDIDWEAQPQMARGVLVVPILGKPFGAALEAGELRIELEDGIPLLRYFDHQLPLRPETLPTVIGLPPVGLADSLSDPASLTTLLSLLDELPRSTPGQAVALLRDFQRLITSERAIERWVREALDAINGTPGEPASFDRLESVLRSQHYRLAFWQVAGEELNYRRFFDVNSLAGIRVEREDVFEETHRLVFELVAQGIVTGIRVDHIDGLYDPGRYLAMLRARLDDAAGGRGHVPIYVEKILAEGEELPASWPVDGATGYEFAAIVDGLAVDRAAERPLTALYADFAGVDEAFNEVSFEARNVIAEQAFAGEINILAMQLQRLAQRQRLHRDHTLRALRRAVRAVLTCFPVYRTYVPEEEGEWFILRAVREASRRTDATLEGALAFLEEVLLLTGDLDPGEREQRIHFRRRFEQVSGPLMAKGVEDTAYYRYNRLISLNEVGASPAVFGIEAGEAHARLSERAARWPGAMSAGATHDTKRSAGARSRISVLSQMPAEWRREVRAWARLNERHRRPLESGMLAPDRNAEYYLYQTLIGTFEPGGGAAYRERVRAHLLKAVREAKLYTNWTRPAEAYEQACLEFVVAILDERRSARFLRRLRSLVESVDAPAAVESLAGVVLRCLAPGFPDIYQGGELRNLRMTEPDNRAPVDFGRRARLLASLHDGVPADLRSDEARVWLWRRLIDVRTRHGELIQRGGYSPVAVDGPNAGRLFAFERSDGRQRLVAVVPRLLRGLADAAGRVDASNWAETTIALPCGEWRELLTGTAVCSSGNVQCEQLLAGLPFAVLCQERA